MSTIVTRAGKGSALEHSEMDANFTNLNNDKLESGSTVATLDINGGTIDGTVIGGASAAAASVTTLSTTGAITLGNSLASGITTANGYINIKPGAGASNHLYLDAPTGASVYIRPNGSVQVAEFTSGGTNLIGTLSATGNVTLGDASTDTVKIAGVVSVGNATPAASGAGVTFPATQVASSDANTLDDYREGTWTPAITRDGSAPTGVTYTTQTGTYTKIGRKVTCRGTINLSGISTQGTGNWQVTGLPFTVAATVAGVIGRSANMSNFPESGYAVGGTTSFYPVHNGTTDSTSTVSTANNLDVCITFEV